MVFSPFLVAPLLPGLALSSAGLARILALPLIVFFGEASYSLYRVHVVVLRGLKAVAPMGRMTGCVARVSRRTPRPDVAMPLTFLEVR